MKTIDDIKKSIKKDFIVENLLKSNGVYNLVALPKVGKSLFALQLANSVATGTTFIGLKTNPSPVLYISTEMDSSQFKERIKIMDLKFNNTNFFLVEQEVDERKLNLMDLQLTFQTFASDYKGKLVIIDMLNGLDLNDGYSINDYQEVGNKVYHKFRELCRKYDFTIILIHHLNKTESPLGSTAIEGSADGTIFLKLDKNLNNKVLLEYSNRDFGEQNLILKREKLLLELSELEVEDLNIHIQLFLNYAISKKEFTFTVSDITSTLRLPIRPSVFGKLLNNNLANLEKEGLHIEYKKTATERLYSAKYEEPIDDIAMFFFILPSTKPSIIDRSALVS